MISKPRLIYRITLVILLITAGFLICGLIFPIINLTFNAKKAKDKINCIKLRWIKCFSAILHLKINTNGNMDSDAETIICNHISWIDIVALGQFIPGYFVAKNDIVHWPVIGFISRQCGTIFIRRGERQQIKETAEKIAWLIKQNRKIMAFPEGTTSDGTSLLPFHASLLQPAILTKTSIQPAVIQFTGKAKKLAPFIGEDAFVPHLVRMLQMPEIYLDLKFLPVISSADKKRQTLNQEVWSAINAEIIASQDFEKLVNY